MKRLTLILMVSLALFAASACGGGTVDDDGGGNGGCSGGGASLETLLQGTWATTCESFSTGGGMNSVQGILTFTGLNFTETAYQYTNGTCSGTGANVGSATGSIAIVGATTANLGSTPVTASKIDATRITPPGMLYDLFYVDSCATPYRLYMGDDSGVNDGSTPAKRPTALDATKPFVKR